MTVVGPRRELNHALEQLGGSIPRSGNDPPAQDAQRVLFVESSGTTCSTLPIFTCLTPFANFGFCVEGSRPPVTML